MSISSALVAAQGRVADAYTAISNKGGTLPATQNLANMPTAINSISGLIGETRTEQLDSTSGNTYTPSTGYNGITSITVTPKNYNRTVTAQTVPSTWAVPSGYSGHGNISVNAVTASIDANIQAGNIKSGVTILGVTGTYGGGGSKYGATINSLLGDTNASGVLQAPSEQTDLVFTGVTDISSYALYYRFTQSAILKTVSFPDLVQVSSTNACYNAFSYGTALNNISLPNLTTITGQNGCGYMFYNNPLITSVSLPKLTTIAGSSGAYYMLGYCQNMTSVSLPELTTINGSSAAVNMFVNDKVLPSLSFPKLSIIQGNQACRSMFSYCLALTDVYFYALTTASFGSNTNQFDNLMQGTGTNVTHTLHFPSNLTNTIAGLSGYPLFGGTSGYVVCAFDLPATS